MLTPGSGAAGVRVPDGALVAPLLGEAPASVDAAVGAALVADGAADGEPLDVQAARTRAMSARLTKVFIDIGYGGSATTACRDADMTQATDRTLTPQPRSGDASGLSPRSVVHG
jgi:hypothetical protein